MKSLLTIFTTVLFCSTITAQCFRTTNDIKYYLNLKTYVTKDHSTKISFTSSSANLSGPGTYKSYYIGKCYIKNAYQAIIELHSNTTHEGLKLYLSCTDKMLTDASGSLLLYEQGTEPSGNTTTSTSRNNATTTKNTKTQSQIHQDCVDHYKNYRTTGACRIYRSGDGKLMREEYFKDGKRDGLWRIWYSNGQLKREQNFKDGKQVGAYKVWYNNGQLQDDKIFIEVQGTLPRSADGVNYQWYKSGQLEVERNIKDGELHGLWRRWYGNGQLRDEVNYKEGKHHGKLRRWNGDGRIMYETEFVDGTGVNKLFHQNGQLYSERNYIDGKLISEKVWDEDGNRTY